MPPDWSFILTVTKSVQSVEKTEITESETKIETRISQSAELKNVDKHKCRELERGKKKFSIDVDYFVMQNGSCSHVVDAMRKDLS